MVDYHKQTRAIKPKIRLLENEMNNHHNVGGTKAHAEFRAAYKLQSKHKEIFEKNNEQRTRLAESAAETRNKIEKENRPNI